MNDESPKTPNTDCPWNLNGKQKKGNKNTDRRNVNNDFEGRGNIGRIEIGIETEIEIEQFIHLFMALVS